MDCTCCRFSSNAAAEDTDVQFRVWAIKSAVKRMPLYVQVGGGLLVAGQEHTYEQCFLVDVQRK